VAAAYAFTVYRSQGQTLPYLIVDIASPPSGKLNLFNLYVTLSRTLMQEDDRLEELNKLTRSWRKKMGWDVRAEAIL
ncbi:hypothetical protein FIBSPDRAFT_730721, partial [Athelia psychrophila]